MKGTEPLSCERLREKGLLCKESRRIGGQWAQMETQEAPSDHQETHSHCEGHKARYRSRNNDFFNQRQTNLKAFKHKTQDRRQIFYAKN